MLPTAKSDQGNQSLGLKTLPWGIGGWELNHGFSWTASLVSSKIPGEKSALSITRHSRPTMIITRPIAQKKARYKVGGRRNMMARKSSVWGNRTVLLLEFFGLPPHRNLIRSARFLGKTWERPPKTQNRQETIKACKLQNRLDRFEISEGFGYLVRACRSGLFDSPGHLPPLFNVFVE